MVNRIIICSLVLFLCSFEKGKTLSTDFFQKNYARLNEKIDIKTVKDFVTALSEDEIYGVNVKIGKGKDTPKFQILRELIQIISQKNDISYANCLEVFLSMPNVKVYEKTLITKIFLKLTKKVPSFKFTAAGKTFLIKGVDSEYIVKKGDTLTRICNRNYAAIGKKAIDIIKVTNGFYSNQINVGQKIIIYNYTEIAK